jgi:signal transduction histidine kinase
VFVVRELHASDQATQQILRSEATLEDLGRLRSALQSAGNPDTRQQAAAEVRRIISEMQQIGRNNSRSDLARLQEVVGKSLDELEREGGTPHAHGVAGSFYHRAAFGLLEALEAKERWLIALDERTSALEKQHAESGLLMAALVVLALQLWIWFVLHSKERDRDRREQWLRDTNQHLERMVRERTKSLAAAYQELVRLQEHERESLARELHDQLGQQMASLMLYLRMIQSRGEMSGTPDERLLRDSVDIARSTYEQIRDLSLELHPSLLNRFGLVSALEWFARHQEACSGCQISVTADPLSDKVSADVATATFRIVQEAVSNALRHGDPSSISVALEGHDTWFDLRVRDNGTGFDLAIDKAPGDGVGLLGMRERAWLVGGDLSIRSSPGSGTEVNAQLPLLKSPAGAEQNAGVVVTPAS